MPRQPKDVTSLNERLKSAELLMGPKVSMNLTMKDLEALALFITKSQALINDLGKTLNIKQSAVNVLPNNQAYNTNSYSINTTTGTVPYRPQGSTSNINTVVDGSGIVKGHDPNALGFGSMGDVSPYNPELDFINPPVDMPIFAPSQEQLEAEARILNSAFTLPEDIQQVVDINDFTQE